jgi:predicted dienelactone hydrolase
MWHLDFSILPEMDLCGKRHTRYPFSMTRRAPLQRLVLALAAPVLFACQARDEPLAFLPAGPTAAPDPSKPGPFAVGVRTVDYVDASRTQPDGGPRRLVTEIWYPAGESARGKPGATYDLLSLATDAQRAQLAGMQVPILHTFGVRDAAPRTDRGPFPLVIFSHGQGGVRWQSTYYTVLLASHGYVVVSPDHPGDTLADALQGQLANPLEGLENRPLDASFLIDTFLSLPPSDPLAGLIDPEQIGITGHSFGALTSLRTPIRDQRIRALVAQAPPSTDIDFAGQLPSFTISVPALIEASHNDQTLPWDPHVSTTWARLHAPRFLLDLVHGGHYTFSDLCAFDLSSVAVVIGFGNISRTLADGCNPPAPPAGVAQPLIDHFAVAFFNGLLRRSPGSMALLNQARADALAPGEAVFTGDP